MITLRMCVGHLLRAGVGLYRKDEFVGKARRIFSAWICRDLGWVRRIGLALSLATMSIVPSVAQSASPVTPSSGTSLNSDANPTNASETGTVSGTVLDKDGAAIPNAAVQLKEGEFSEQSVSGGDGTFTFKSVPAGAFELSFSASGFATLHESGSVRAGESNELPPVQMVVSTTIEVNVSQTRVEIAEEQIHVEEKQRILGVVPNYYVSYDPDPKPLTARQKVELGRKFTFDPVALGIAGLIAGVQQATNSFSGYGQGAQGYFKRFGASYADFVSGTFFGNVVFPIVFKQDPRYFYKGTGSRKSRLMYALANAVICKGDNGRWQPNYSSVLGSLAAGGLSNLYYPASNRNGAALTFENAALGVAGSAGAGVVQEFFIRKVTPHRHDQSTNP